LKPLEPYDEDKDHKNKNLICYWPIEGQFVKYYKYWMLLNCLSIMIFVIGRIGFEKKPWYYVVVYDCYLDFVFFIDMIRIFTTPIFNESGKMITNRKLIAKAYITTWFLFDLWGFYPLSYLRYSSNYDEGGKDNLENWIHQNYERLPRFYKILLIL
jgi:hypothetical protein